VRCTNVWCGPRNCRESPELCLGHQVCVPAPIDNCLAPGCAPWGECRSLSYGKSLTLPSVPAPSDCWPNQAVLSAHCARLNLLLDRSKLKPGTSVEAVCGHLREIAATHQTITGTTDLLVILCEMKMGFNNNIEVTMVSHCTFCKVMHVRVLLYIYKCVRFFNVIKKKGIKINFNQKMKKVRLSLIEKLKN